MSTIENIPYDELVIGQKASYSHTVTDEDIILFAKLSGDTNPVHLDEEYAATTQFGGRIAHGMLTGALISAAVALNMPGPGTIYLGQTMRFRAPVRIGDTLTVNMELTTKNDKRKIVTLDIVVVNQNGDKVVTGESTALAPTEKIICQAQELPKITLG
ncbi:MAG: MaoC/PaaZ C-terminal domain-containing protein [Pseudomonadales bacterium]